MTFERFNFLMKNVLKQVIDDPSNIIIDNELLEEYQIQPLDLLSKLLNRSIIQQIDDFEYVIPRKNFDRKINRFFIMMESIKPNYENIPILEDEGGDIVGGGDAFDSVNDSAPIGPLTTKPLTKKLYKP